jgi:hypothetical protein
MEGKRVRQPKRATEALSCRASGCPPCCGRANHGFLSAGNLPLATCHSFSSGYSFIDDRLHPVLLPVSSGALEQRQLVFTFN